MSLILGDHYGIRIQLQGHGEEKLLEDSVLILLNNRQPIHMLSHFKETRQSINHWIGTSPFWWETEEV